MRPMPHIVLVGLMGSGKSTIGKKLARRTGWLFSDTDNMVEAYSRRTIADIFATDGEEAFRDLEEEMVTLAMSDEKPGIIATGGGAVLRESNRQLLFGESFSVYLHSSPRGLLNRIRRSTSRPLLKNEDPLGTLHNLLQAREPLYQMAGLHVGVEARPIRQICSDIWSAYCEAFPAARSIPFGRM